MNVTCMKLNSDLEPGIPAASKRLTPLVEYLPTLSKKKKCPGFGRGCYEVLGCFLLGQIVCLKFRKFSVSKGNAFSMQAKNLQCHW